MLRTVSSLTVIILQHISSIFLELILSILYMYDVFMFSCRSACLQLHEDSTEDLKREFNAEREKIEMQYKTEINRLRSVLLFHKCCVQWNLSLKD